MENKNKIVWTENNKYFGLDYPTMLGKYKSFEFDIRYDCDGDFTTPPDNCGLWMIIYYNNAKIDQNHGHSVDSLVKIAEKYLENHIKELTT